MDMNEWVAAQPRALHRPGFWFAPFAVLPLALGVYFAAERGRESPSVVGESAAALYAISLPDQSGAQQSLGQWRGKVLVVNFWATWCAPCRDEMPEFVRIQRELADKGLQF